MYITMCLYITITILLWVLSIYPYKALCHRHSIIIIQFSHMEVTNLHWECLEVDCVL